MVFVTGVCGQLGHDCVNELVKRGYEVVGSDLAEKYSSAEDAATAAKVSYLQPETTDRDAVQRTDTAQRTDAVQGADAVQRTDTTRRAGAAAKVSYLQLDITDRDAVQRAITEMKPDVIIHCAAWTAVDAAEDPENQAKVDAINHLGTQYIAEAAQAVDAAMVYISTDYVFSGRGERPWCPDDMDYAPLNVYGASKLAGELAVRSLLEKYFIVRIAWVFGLNGNNFIKTMLRVGRTHDTVRVVDDQIGTPTYTLDLARLLVDMIGTGRYGYYHATNSEDVESGYISWADFAEEIFRQAGMDVAVERVSTQEYGLSKAARPLNSRLDKAKIAQSGFTPLPGWRDAVHRYLVEIGEIVC